MREHRADFAAEHAWQVSGRGPALIITGDFRSPGGSGLGRLLWPHFTVYQRRRPVRRLAGLPTHSREAEAEDLVALIAEVSQDEAPFVYGYSSGGMVVLDAAEAGAPMRGVVLFEPNETRPPDRSFFGGAQPSPRNALSVMGTGVTVLWGQKSSPTARDQAKAVARAVPGALWLELPGEAHNVTDRAIADILLTVFVHEVADVDVAAR